MDELIIKNHDFDEAKEKIRSFTNGAYTNLSFDKVDEKKGVGERVFDVFFGGDYRSEHKVTGEELNKVTSKIQKHLEDVNSTQIGLIKEFRHVYEALEALDKDYIQAILISIRATQRTSEKLKETQDDVKETVETQKKTLEVLKKFKQKLDNYAHLGDIDKIWSDCQKWHDEITELSSDIRDATSTSAENANRIGALEDSNTQIGSKVIELDACLGEQITRLDATIDSLAKIEGITHLHDIDEMWESLANAHNSIKACCEALNATKETVSEQQNTVEKLVKFVESISQQEHLQDIDKIWEKTEANYAAIDDLKQQSTQTAEEVQKNQEAVAALIAYKEKLSDYEHLEDVDSLWDSDQLHAAQIKELQEAKEQTQSMIEASNNSLATVDEAAKNAIQMMNKKIIYAYMIAGGSFALALIEMLIIFLR